MSLGLRLRSLLGGLVVVVSQVGAVAAPSYAEDGSNLAVSLDSDHDWVSTIDQALFVPDTPWHPGDLPRKEVVYVRNTAKKTADLTLLLDRATQTDATHGFLSLQVRVRDGDWKEIVISDPSQTLDLPQVPSGAVVPVTLQASLSASAPSGVQPSRADLTFEIKVIANSAAPDAGPATKSGGSNLFLAPLFLIVALLLLLGLRIRRWIIEQRTHGAADEDHENGDEGDDSEDHGEESTAESRGAVE